MTNIVYWNIENFGINKFNDPSRKRPRYGQGRYGGNSPAVASAQKRNLLAAILNSTQPDIIVVVEVSTGAGGGGDLVTNSGGLNGASYILDLLRAHAPDPNCLEWRLVPPLKVGAGGLTESVAVFYRGISGVVGTATEVRRYFTGPDIWTAANVSVAAGVAAAYPGVVIGAPNIQEFLDPPGTVARAIPAGTQYNGTLAESTVAARIHFTADPGAAIAPPVAGGFINYNGLRQPYMVTFAEEDNTGAITRNLSIIAVHSPPNFVGATNFMNVLLAGAADVADPPDIINHNEVKIVCGDFNLNAITALGARTTAYNSLVNNLNYTALLYPPAVMPGGINIESYQGYLATHIKPPRSNAQRTKNSRFLWSDNTLGAPVPSEYPGYRYIGSDRVNNFFSIDNILVQPAPGAPQFTIMNPVVGTPFNLVGGLPVGVPTGVRVLAQRFNNLPLAPAIPPAGPLPIAWPQAPAPNYAAGLARSLNGWSNYGYLRSTSDHLALFADI